MTNEQCENDAYLKALEHVGNYAYENKLIKEYNVIHETYKKLHQEKQLEPPVWRTLH